MGIVFDSVSFLITFGCGFLVGIFSIFVLVVVNMLGDSEKGPNGEIIDRSAIMFHAKNLFGVVFKHPSWLMHLQYKDGSYPFSCLSKDVFTDILKMRPPS